MPKCLRPHFRWGFPYRLGVFGRLVVEEAVHNLAGRRIYNLENYDDFDPGVIFVMKMSRVGFGGGDGRVCDTAY